MDAVSLVASVSDAHACQHLYSFITCDATMIHLVTVEDYLFPDSVA